MKKKIVARGRSILGSDSSDFIRSLETKEGEKVFSLKSGNQAKFTLSTGFDALVCKSQMSGSKIR